MAVHQSSLNNGTELTEVWSIPPIKTTDTKGSDDLSILLRQGVVTQILCDSEWLLQNVSENEDEYVEFSFHGDRDGIWGKLNTHSFLRFKVPIYILNRTHIDNVKVAVFKQAATNR